MKKIISVLLALVLLLSAVFPSLVFAENNNTESLEWKNTNNWFKNTKASTNIGNNIGAVAYTAGSGLTLDTTTFAGKETLKLDANDFRVSLPLNTKANTDYRLTFSYYSDAVTTVTPAASPTLQGNTYAITNTGIFIPNHPSFEGISGDRLGLAYTMSYLNIYAFNYQIVSAPAGHNWTVDSNGAKTGFADQNFDGVADVDARTYKTVENYHGIEAGKWYTLSFEFNSREFEDIAFTLRKIAGANMWLSDITLDDLSTPAGGDNSADASEYFENPNNWVLSLRGTQANRRNISVDGSDGATFSGEKGKSYHNTDSSVSLITGGTSLKLIWATHASNIALPNIEKGKAYRIKFSYKVVTSSEASPTKQQIKNIGIYSPKALEDAIAKGNTTDTFVNGTIGWNTLDSFRGTDGVYRYRDETLSSGAKEENRYAHNTGDYTYAGANAWYTEELYFNVTDYTDLQLVIIPGDDNKGGIFLDGFEFEQVEKVPDELMPESTIPEPEDPTEDWISNAVGSKNIGTNEGALAYTGAGITLDKTTFSGKDTLKLDNGAYRVSLPLKTEANKDYKFTFSYYTDTVNTVKTGDPNLLGRTFVITNTGIFIPNHSAFEGISGDRLGLAYTMSYLSTYAYNYQMNTPAGHLWTVDSTGAKTGFADQNFDGAPDKDARTFKPMANFHDIEVGKWYTLSFEFNSRDFKDIAFTLLKEKGNMWLGDIKLEEVQKTNPDPNPNPDPEPTDDYFETPANWGASAQGSQSSPCKNILVNGISNTSVATKITWANFSKSGSSLLINNPNHTSHIKLPNIETGATYKLKFSYKPTGGQEGSTILRYVGIFDPEFTQNKIETSTTATYSDLKTGFIAVDAYTLLNAKRNRFENGVYENNCHYGTLNSNIYDEEWQEISIHFTAKAGLDNLYLLIAYTTEAGKLLVDNFTLEKVDAIPEEEMPGWVDPNYTAPNKVTIDFEGEAKQYSHLLIKDRVTYETVEGRDGKETSALHINEVIEPYSNVTYPGFSTVTTHTDPVFTIPVQPGTLYSVSVWLKADKPAELYDYRQRKFTLIYDFRNTHADSILQTDWYYNLQTAPYEWVEYTYEFVTMPNQYTASFGINAAEAHPSFWIDDITYTQVPAGYRETTALSYCEEPFNVISNNSIALSNTVKEKTVLEIPVLANSQSTFGINISGKGKFTLAWDKEGENVIRTYNVADVKERLGGVLVMGGANDKLYAIFEPQGSGITYSDLYVFKRYSLVTNSDLGYEENINARVPLSFSNIPTINADSLEASTSQSVLEEDYLNSPSTGDTTEAIWLVAITFAISAVAVLLLGKRKNKSIKE